MYCPVVKAALVCASGTATDGKTNNAVSFTAQYVAYRKVSRNVIPALYRLEKVLGKIA